MMKEPKNQLKIMFAPVEYVIERDQSGKTSKQYLTCRTGSMKARRSTPERAHQIGGEIHQAAV
jgi:hypothetical protein